MTVERIEAKAAFAVDDEGSITGKAWDFSAPDRVGDVIEPAAFADAVGKALPMLFAHDQAQAVGTWDSVSVDADGLLVSGKLLVNDVARAREVRALVKAQSVTGLSVGFITQKASPRKGGGRTISKLDLVECSLVAVPAHPGARVAIVKEADLANENTPAAQTEEVAAPEQAEVKAADLKAANDNIEALAKRLEAAETALARPKTAPANDNEPDEAAKLERKAFGTYLRLGNQTSPDDLKALTVSSDPQAGYLAPAEMSTEFIRDLTEFSPIRQYASVRTTGAPSVKYPKRTGITNAAWEGETEQSGESTASFGQLEVDVHKLTTYVDISNELLADSGGAAEAEVRLALSEDFGKKEATAFVNGSGAKQPEGLMTHADIDHTVNGHATNLSTDKLIDLLYAMPAAYRNAPGAAWAMNGTTLAAVRKLKDGNGVYIWAPGLTTGQPETILGKPVVEMVDMPDIGDGNFPIIFGDFAGYRIVDRLALSVLSDPYTQARNGITRMHATRRVGGRVMQAARFRKLKTATS